MEILPEGVIPFFKDECHDLKSGAPVRQSGEYVVFSYDVPRSTVLVLRGWVPYLMERTDLGVSGSESASLINPSKVNRFVVFEPYINDASPHLIENDYNQMLLESAANDATRIKTRGISHVSGYPHEEAAAYMRNSMYQLVINGGSTFKVIFKVLSVGANFKTFTIGSTDNRIDFAGVIVVGHQMPESIFEKLKNKGN